MDEICDRRIWTQNRWGKRKLKNVGYHYRMNFPESYRCERGLKIVKFERDYKNSLEYEFIGAYPVSVNSMPVGYDSSGLLKCTVSMTYLRYVITELIGPPEQPITSTQTQNAAGTQKDLPVPQEKESKVFEVFDIRDRKLNNPMIQTSVMSHV